MGIEDGVPKKKNSGMSFWSAVAAILVIAALLLSGCVVMTKSRYTSALELSEQIGVMKGFQKCITIIEEENNTRR